jgi:hypothetical protein
MLGPSVFFSLEGDRVQDEKNSEKATDGDANQMRCASFALIHSKK